MRRAFVLASAERYIALVVNLATIAIIARILTPSEFGVSVLGLAAISVMELLRAFGTDAYLVHRERLTMGSIRTAFTAILVLTLVMGALMFLSASWLEHFYATPGLAGFLYVSLISYLFGPFVTPVYSLLRRELRFGALAIINVSALVVNALTTTGLVLLGFSFMSFAWANLISGLVGMLLGLYFRPDLGIFRVSIREWRPLVNFARYDSVATTLAFLGLSLPYLILGRLLSIDALGLYQRATRICELPKKVLLGGLSAVVLPALAEHKRDGGSLKDGYLTGISFITALQWPSLLTVTLLAHPLVIILLGSQWVAAIPLVRIMAAALLINFSVALTYSTLVVAGAVRHALLLYAIVVPVTAVVLVVAGSYGVEAAALSMFITVPIEVLLSVYLVRLHLGFSWTELAEAMKKSAIVAVLSAVGPILVMAVSGFRTDLSPLEGLLALALAGVGWLVGLWLTGHPLFGEMLRATDHILNDAWRSRLKRLSPRLLGIST